MFGADEAGKGPVVGSMFAAAVAVADAEVLPAGIDDSKKLDPARREEIAERLRADDRVTVGVAEITPREIDDPETDMNTLTVEAQARAVAEVAGAGEAGVADAGDTSESRFARRVADAVPTAIELTAEHGADEQYAVVGAASVVAKVERDAHVAALADDYPEYGDLGSGYPNDSATKAFLEAYVADHGEVPDCARRSWATCDRLLAGHEQSGLGDF